MAAIKALFGSRKFLLLLLDTVISVVLYFIGKYVPDAEADVKFIILALQPVIISVIITIAYEDGKIIPAKIEAELAEKYEASKG